MLKVIPLGGLGEIGLNMMVFECDEYALVVDAGLMFPEAYMPGVDVVIPDFHYLREKRGKVRSIILTHGHEDHIGAMPFFLREFNIPVFGTSFTIELLREKLKEHGLASNAHMRKIRPGEVTEFGPFRVEFISVLHSIVDGVGLAIDSPEGLIIHTGDFKIDHTPVDGHHTDLVRFAHHGERNVLALFSDSTNVEKEGFTLSESEVTKTLEDLLHSSNGRAIFAVFASNITRIQQLINLAVEFDRRILFSGKSMKTNVRIARDEGLIHIPKDAEINEKEIAILPDDRIAIITTGSQGEPMSSLTRIAQDIHKTIKVKKGDTIILSSRFIPGNERAITTIINNLYRAGAEVVYEKVSDIHSSGHAYREELKLMLNLVRPKYFVPIHGEYRHLVRHMQLGLELGMRPDQVFLLENGTVLSFEDGRAKLQEPVRTGRVFVDGKGVGDVGELVLRDRRRLSEDGVVIAFLAVDEQTGEVVYGPDIISRGFVVEDQSAFIIEEAKSVVMGLLDEVENRAHMDWTELGPDIKRRLKRFFFKVIERSPIILPVIIPL